MSSPESSKEVVPKSMSVDVRSSAVVKYSSIGISPTFSRLQLNTNLNVPPSNWLRSTSVLEQFFRDIPRKREHPEFSSFNMANNFPDLTGEVDVVSDAENIKKLLKIPYSRSSHISMMVHRIGNTLLLDEFDIHKHLLRREQEEWSWLRQFFYASVAKNMEGKMKCVPRKSKSRNTLQNRSMYSKFLYHSLSASECEDGSVAHMSISDLALQKQGVSVKGDDANGEEESDSEEQRVVIPLPDPLPKPEDSEYNREVYWTFEDLHMLIGTDLPIFGGGTHPCVSLKLRDSACPINVLTGLDCWLDNLMCNVPEVAMCFHLNGIVQKYELIKTEDIPQMEDCQFDPLLVTGIARNILSFLKSNATKEGHTYWLYKNADDDVVKLYDLTVLCGEEIKDSNPFTVPVGILLYRVARNMRQSSGRKKIATIRTLLENCLLLLNEETHSQVCTSANYLLSDLFVPDSSLQDVWTNGENDSDEDNEDTVPVSEEESEAKTEISLGLSDLCRIDRTVRRGWKAPRTHPIAGTVEERCRDALNYIRKGLDCLGQDLSNIKMKSKEAHKSTCIVEEQATCNQSEAIPLHYKPLAPRVNIDNLLQISPTMHCGTESWHCLSKALLLRKASMAYYALAREHLSVQKYGYTLKHVRFALHCLAAMKTLVPSKEKDNRQLLMMILELSGDVRLMISHISRGFEEHKRDFGDMSEEEAAVLDAAQNVLTNPELEWVYKWTISMDQNLVHSSKCYELAYSICTEIKTSREVRVNLAKRYGNSLNELGVWYMNQAQVFLQSGALSPSEKMKELWEKSQSCFTAGEQIFSDIHDKANRALLLSNNGRLMRLCAQCYTQQTMQQDRPEFSPLERQYYSKAVDCYQNALSILGPGDKGRIDLHDIRNSVRWDLSTTYFNMAMLLQDYPPHSTCSQDEVEKSVTDFMNKSLKYCLVEGKDHKLPLVQQFRAATINHRLASLYHHSFISQTIDQKRRHLRQLAENHYERAYKLFNEVESFTDILRVQLERVAMLEGVLEGQTSTKSRLRSLVSILSLLTTCASLVNALSSLVEETAEGERSEEDKLSLILESRIQFLLLQLVKTYSSANKSKTDLTAKLKGTYARSLQTRDKEKNLQARWSWIQSMLSELLALHEVVAKDTT